MSNSASSRQPVEAGPGEPPAVGRTLAALRQSRALSLDELSRRAGVSKSMLSQIERNQANPTVAVVWRLANALGVPLAQLLGTPQDSGPAPIEVVGASATPALRAADSRCELRILGPIGLAGRFEWYELTMQAGGTLLSAAHDHGAMEHLTVFEGTAEVVSGPHRQSVRAGETARYAVDVPHAIANPGKTALSALLVVVHPD